MSISNFKTQAWVLNTLTFSEHSLIVDFLTSDGQKIKAQLKGVRRQQPKQFSAVQLGSFLNLVYKPQRNAPWVSVQQQTVVDTLPIKAYRAFLFFAHMLEIAHKIDYNPEAGANIHQTLKQVFVFLNSAGVSMQSASPASTAALFFYSAQIWQNLNLKIHWQSCQSCQRPTFKPGPKKSGHGKQDPQTPGHGEPGSKPVFRNTTYHFYPLNLSLTCAECEQRTGDIGPKTLADWHRLEQNADYLALASVPAVRLFQSFKLFNRCVEAFSNVQLNSLTLLDKEWLNLNQD